MKTVFALMGALVLAGCGSIRYPTTYVLNFPPPVPQAPPLNGALGPPRSPNLDVRNISAKAASCTVPVRRKSGSTNTIVGR
jgi:hypothetical protein